MLPWDCSLWADMLLSYISFCTLRCYICRKCLYIFIHLMVMEWKHGKTEPQFSCVESKWAIEYVLITLNWLSKCYLRHIWGSVWSGESESVAGIPLSCKIPYIIWGTALALGTFFYFIKNKSLNYCISPRNF